MLRKFLTVISLLAVCIVPAFADYKITQKRTVEGMGQEYTVYTKGVRERRESKMVMAGMGAAEAAMVANMMPNLIQIDQCDLKQNLSINDRKKSFFIDYYDWSTVPPEKLARRPNQKMVVKGTATMSSTVTDLGKRQQMYGMTAKWLKAVQMVETSPDSCDGASSIRIEQEGWFVPLRLESERCAAPPIQPESGGCRPKVVIKSAQDPGFLLEGTIKMYEKNKLQGTTQVETTALALAPLDQALFEVPKGFKEVDSLSELTGAGGEYTERAVTVVDGKTEISTKTVAIDFFSGNASKLDQDKLRGYISQKLTNAGMSGRMISSQAEISSGSFVNVIGVELKKIKESGASKIGGLFGKVTNTDAGKIGNTQAEIVVTIYGKDGKTVVASAPATVDVKGTGDDAVKAAIDQVIDGLIAKIK